MATAVRLRQPQTGIVKTGYFGFSWTSFFFGGIPAMMRGDVALGVGLLIAGLVFGAFSAGLLWFVVGLIWAFIYNKRYTLYLLERGYVFEDEPSRVGEAKAKLGVY
jgi:hypothetical protein